MKSVHFITPTKLSLLDITSMGDSIKRNNANTIGVFDSGLKYSIALMMRADVDISIKVKGNSENDLTYIQDFHFSTYTETDHKRSKELIQVEENVIYTKASCLDITSTHKTGFAKALGHNWELWMSLREVYSNMLDEGGYYIEDELTQDIEEGTVITLKFNYDSEFGEVWDNKHLYINEDTPRFELGSGVQVLNNAEQWLRIYKQNILVFEDKEVPSRYAYNVVFGEIDERRILSNLYSVEGSIIEAMRSTKNEEFLREIIKEEFPIKQGEFLTGRTSYYKASDLIHEIAFEVYSRVGKVDSYEWLMEGVKKRKDCKIGGKVIESIEDSLWSYTTKVTIESQPVAVEVEENKVSVLQHEINKMYNFTLDVPYKSAKLKGSKVVADKYEKCLIFDTSFSVEEDMGELIVQYLDLTQKGNVIKNLSNYICKLLEK